MPVLRQIAQLGQPVLRGVAGKIADPADPAVQALIDDMLVTAADANGVGIAAPQVFEPLSLFIVASRPNPRYPYAPEMEPTAMINPEILWASDDKEKGWEGCLSIPGLYVEIIRPNEVLMRGRTLDGNEIEIEAKELMGRLFQHELDHLNGVLMFDRMTPEQRKGALADYRRILEEQSAKPRRLRLR